MIIHYCVAWAFITWNVRNNHWFILDGLVPNVPVAKRVSHRPRLFDVPRITSTIWNVSPASCAIDNSTQEMSSISWTIRNLSAKTTTRRRKPEEWVVSWFVYVNFIISSYFIEWGFGYVINDKYILIITWVICKVANFWEIDCRVQFLQKGE